MADFRDRVQSINSSFGKQESLMNELQSLVGKLQEVSASDGAALTNISAGLLTISQSISEICVQQKSDLDVATNFDADVGPKTNATEISSLCYNDFIWTIDNFISLSNSKEILSPEFYASPLGYRIKAKLSILDGIVGIHWQLVKGLYDAFLKWPFTERVQISLLNQVDEKKSITRIVYPDSTTPGNVSKKPNTGKPNQFCGMDNFTSLLMLTGSNGNNVSDFLRNNQIYVKIRLVDNQQDVPDQTEGSASADNASTLPFSLAQISESLRSDFSELAKENYFLWCIENVEHSRRFRTINSDSFYIGVLGYKMKCQIEIEDKWLSVFIKLLKGNYDDILEWPFKRPIKFTLLNQVDEKKHVSKILSPKPDDANESDRWIRPVDNDHRGAFGLDLIKLDRLFGLEDFISNYFRNNRFIIKVELISCKTD